ncbi:unnamed protein product [Mucor hiemalis]
MTRLEDVYTQITKKWLLTSSGRFVKDVMYNAFKSFKYEHSSMSYILDASDDLWKQHFSQVELNEIKSLLDNAPSEDLPSKMNEKARKPGLASNPGEEKSSLR